jgi:hypothetical protein
VYLRFRVLGLKMRMQLVLSLGLLWAFTAGAAWAHGGGVPQLINVDAGPYWVSVWTQPDPLRVGQAHITVAVSEPSNLGGSAREAGPPVLDARVQVEFKPIDHSGEMLVTQATHEEAVNKLFYEADLDLVETGRWQVTVAVAGADGSGSASFDTDVVEASSSNQTCIGGVGVIVVAAVWVAQKYRAQRRGV